jgi:hypothetical protein
MPIEQDQIADAAHVTQIQRTVVPVGVAAIGAAVADARILALRVREQGLLRELLANGGRLDIGHLLDRQHRDRGRAFVAIGDQA